MSKCVICGHKAVKGDRFCEVCGPAYEDAKTAKEVTGTCKMCGAKFTYIRLRSRSPHRYCPACKVRRVKERRAKYEAKRRQLLSQSALLPAGLTRQLAGMKYQATSFDQVRKARSRPSGMSAVRWRIEKRRRANAAYYSHCDLP